MISLFTDNLNFTRYKIEDWRKPLESESHYEKCQELSGTKVWTQKIVSLIISNYFEEDH